METGEGSREGEREIFLKMTENLTMGALLSLVQRHYLLVVIGSVTSGEGWGVRWNKSCQEL